MCVKKIFFLCGLLICIFNITSINASEKIDVFVSILPQKYFVEQIGGDKVNTTVMVDSGQSPVTYEPTPSQMAKLQNAKLFFRIGVPFEEAWIEQIYDLYPDLKIINCCKGIKKLHNSAHTEHNHGNSYDPHIWTSPNNGKFIALTIKNELINIDPDGKSVYEKNYLLLSEKLDILDQEIREIIGSHKNKLMIVSHPSWGYFADYYNLRQITIEQKGSELRARTFTRLIETAKRESVKTVFVQKQFNKSAAILLAREINAEVVEIDPLSEDYITNLRMVARTIAGMPQ